MIPYWLEITLTPEKTMKMFGLSQKSRKYSARFIVSGGRMLGSRAWMLPLVAGMTTLVPASAQAANILTAGNISSTAVTGVHGVLRDATWSTNNTPSAVTRIYDGVIEPIAQQWNNNSFWWDDDPSVNATPLSLVLNLNNSYTISSLFAQADDNDALQVDYFDGTNWISAWTIPAVGGFGLQNRSSGALTPFTTTALRITGAFPSDRYYALSELRAEGVAAGVPEPATWAMMILGFGLVGGALRTANTRRRQKVAVRFAF